MKQFAACEQSNVLVCGNLLSRSGNAKNAISEKSHIQYQFPFTPQPFCALEHIQKMVSN
jgi:hypothetical protein